MLKLLKMTSVMHGKEKIENLKAYLANYIDATKYAVFRELFANIIIEKYVKPYEIIQRLYCNNLISSRVSDYRSGYDKVLVSDPCTFYFERQNFSG